MNLYVVQNFINYYYVNEGKSKHTGIILAYFLLITKLRINFPMYVVSGLRLRTNSFLIGR